MNHDERPASEQQLAAIAELVGQMSDLGIVQLCQIIDAELDCRRAQRDFRDRRN